MLRFPGLSPHSLLVLSVLLLTGCGDGIKRAAVEGTVTLDGAPVDGGRIVFVAVDKKGVNGFADIEGGKYVIPAAKGPSLGAHRVEIAWYQKTGKQIVGSDPPNMVDETIQVIPKKYNAQSTVQEEIKAGKNTFNYDLKSK